MALMEDHDARGGVHSVTRLDAAAYLVWLRGPDVETTRRWLHGELHDERPRGAAPWVEHPPAELFSRASDARRVRERWRAFTSVFPKKMRGCAWPLVVDADVPIELTGGRALQRRAWDELIALATRRLDPDGLALNATERQRLRRHLRAIDPPVSPLVRLAWQDAATPALGEVAVVSATNAAAGSWSGQASTARHPGVGPIASISGQDVLVAPDDVRRTFIL